MELPDFEKLVDEAIAGLPENIRARMDNVAVIVENEPTPEQRRQNRLRPGDLLFGLYEGIPQTERGGAVFSGMLPDKITIFKSHIEAVATTPEEIKEEVRETVWHEVAHHFGIGEVRVRQLSRARKRKSRAGGLCAASRAFFN